MDIKWFCLFYVFFIGLKHVTCTVPVYSTALETELRTLLFTNYEILQRPSQTVNVSIALNLLTLNALDIKSQTLSSAGYFTMIWTDNALKWNTLTNYSNINFLFSSEAYMWRPAIVIENSVSDLEVFSDEDTLIRVNSEGVASWSPGGVFTTYCEADITYYPLDTQECDIILSTWAYTSGEVLLQLSGSSVSLEYFRINGEWELLSTTTSTETTSRESQSYSRLFFTIKARRRSMFHILNTLFPVILMASLVIFAFKLPPESGERVGMSLTVLLTYAVYLTLIADTIPQTSLHISVLSVYLTMVLMLSTLSVIFTIYILHFFFKPTEEPVPPWLLTFTRKFLSKVICCKEITCACQTDRISTGETLHESGVNDGALASPKGTEKTVTELTEDTILSIDARSYAWVDIARMLDAFFMRVFAILMFLCTFICCMILSVQYNS